MSDEYLLGTGELDLKRDVEREIVFCHPSDEPPHWLQRVEITSGAHRMVIRHIRSEHPLSQGQNVVFSTKYPLKVTIFGLEAGPFSMVVVSTPVKMVFP